MSAAPAILRDDDDLFEDQEAPSAWKQAARRLLKSPTLRAGTVDDELARAILAREEAGR